MRASTWPVKLVLMILSALGAFLVAADTLAHELMENRAALVLRNDRLISVTLFVSLDEVLQKALMPNGDRFEHTARLAALSDADFAKQFNAAKRTIQAGIAFKSVAGKPLKVTGWVWPEVAAAQKYLRDITMRTLVTPGAHLHEAPVEVRTQIQSDEPLASVRVEMPDALRPMTLIATRPRQSRMNSSTPSLVIDF